MGNYDMRKIMICLIYIKIKIKRAIHHELPFFMTVSNLAYLAEMSADLFFTYFSSH
jgi:hypothetical protein